MSAPKPRTDELGYANAQAFVDGLFRKYFDVRPLLHVDEWADAERVLPRQSSAEPGPYRTARTPYARQIMRDLSDDFGCEDVVLMMATQLIKSEMGLNWLGSIIAQTPAPTMIVQATVDTGKRYGKQRVAPMIDSCPALRARVKPAKSRGTGNTLQEKEFPGGRLVITGSNSAAGLASMPARFIHFDERDDYPDDVDGQGEPTMIARARQDSFRRRKRLTTSSPKRAKGFSRIEAEFQSGTRFYYHVPCPDCGEKQRLEFEQLRTDDSDRAKYACLHCGSLIEEFKKPELFAGGEWIAENPTARIRSYHLNSLYSPLGWLSWTDLVSEHQAAELAEERGDSAPMKAFQNTRLARTTEEKSDKTIASELRARAEPYALREMPDGALVLTAGIDTQDDRLEVVLYGWGRGEESWVLDYTVLHGDPGEVSTWEKLSAYLATEFLHACGAKVRISAEAIDTGGHFTTEVYAWCYERRLANRRTFAIKGAQRHGLPIRGKPTRVDVNYRGKVMPGGLTLNLMGTDTAKDLLHNRLQMEHSGPGYLHLSTELPDAFFEGMTAEHRTKRRVLRTDLWGWQKINPNARNEPWDCSVYALFAAHALDLNRYTEKMWDLRRAKLERLAAEQNAAKDPNVAQAPRRTPPPRGTSNWWKQDG